MRLMPLAPTIAPATQARMSKKGQDVILDAVTLNKLLNTGKFNSASEGLNGSWHQFPLGITLIQENFGPIESIMKRC